MMSACLPGMLDVLRGTDAEVVVGSRYTERRLSSGFTKVRQAMSFIATRLAQMILRAKLSDPVSGFFMARREVFEGAIRNLSGIGNKILVDIFASSPAPLRFRELPYEFRARLHGESKLDTLTVWEYLVLLADKLFGRFIPVRLILFSLVGATGVVVHLLTFWAVLLSHFAESIAAGHVLQFKAAQAIATGVAATSNFFLNNLLTYRDRRLRGWACLARAHFVLGDLQRRRGRERALFRRGAVVFLGTDAAAENSVDACLAQRDCRRRYNQFFRDILLHLGPKRPLSAAAARRGLPRFESYSQEPITHL